MTNKTLLISALADASGIPAATVARLLDDLLPHLPPGHTLDEDRTEAEAQRLLAAFRAEREGIRQWLARGYLLALADGWPPHPQKGEQRPKEKGHAGRRRHNHKPRRRGRRQGPPRG